MSKKWLIAAPILLVLIGILTLMIWISVATVQVVRDSDFNLHLSLGDQVSVEAEEAQTVDAAGIDKLRFDTDFSNIRLSGWDDETIQVTIHKTAWGYNQEAAQETLGQMLSAVTPSGNALEISTEIQRSISIRDDRQSPRFDITVQMPRRLLLEVENSMGDVSLENGSGSAYLGTDFGTITVNGFSDGSLKVLAQNGLVSLSQVDTALEVGIHNDFGEVQVESSKMKSLAVEAKNANIVLRDLQLEQTLTAQTDFGEITVYQVQAEQYDCKTTNGAINLTGAKGNLNLSSSYGNLSIYEAQEARLNLETGTGTILYQGSLGEGNHTVRTEFGDITLQIPAESALDVNLTTRFGKIETDFKLTITDATISESQVTGEINGGGDALTVETQNGNIQLKDLEN